MHPTPWRASRALILAALAVTLLVSTLLGTATTAAAAPTYTLTVTASGPGAVTQDPPGRRYTAGSRVALTPAPAPGAAFLGWTVDGTFRGWGAVLTSTMITDRTVVATYAAAPIFGDVTPGTATATAVRELAARGIVRGYGEGRFGPDDTTLRAQMAALIVRAMGWEDEDHGTPFPDRGAIDADLWRVVGTLAHRGVARGYPDGTYGPAEEVLRAQAISLIVRAMIAEGHWTLQADEPARFPDLHAASGHRRDLATYAHYVGTLPGDEHSPAASGWDRPATRAWLARALWAALDGHFGLPAVQ